MKDMRAIFEIIDTLPFDNNLERNAILVPQIRRNIIVEKWTGNTLSHKFEEMSLENSFFHAAFCLERIKIFFG